MKNLGSFLILFLLVSNLGYSQIQLDSNFNPFDNGGQTGFYGSIPTRCHALANGKTIFAGVRSFRENQNLFLVMLDSNGIRDTLFSAKANKMVKNIEIQPDGKFLISGSFDSINNQPRKQIARLNPDGTLDFSFNTGSASNGEIWEMAIQNDGKILVSGIFTQFAGVPRAKLVRLLPDGTLDATFDPGVGVNPGNSQLGIKKILPLTDGKILIGGDFFLVGGQNKRYLARVLENGSVDNSFSTPFHSTACCQGVNSLVLLPDNKILVGGWFFDTISNQPVENLIRILPNGDLDPSFSIPNLKGNILSLSVLGDGKILASGFVYSQNGSPAYRIVRLHENGTADDAFMVSAGNDGAIMGHSVQPDGKIVLIGQFTKFAGFRRNYVARLLPDGSLDKNYLRFWGAISGVNAMVKLADGKFLLGGEFKEYNGVMCNGLVRVGADGELDSSFYPPKISGIVNCLAVNPDGKILIGGLFSAVENQSHKNIARLNENGQTDETFQTSFNKSVHDIKILVVNDMLVSGFFDSVNTTKCRVLAKLDLSGQVDFSFASKPKPNSVVYTINIQPQGRILIGGLFDSIGPNHKSRIAAIFSDGTVDNSFQGYSQMQGSISKIKTSEDGKIYASGSLASVGGNSRKGIARFASNGILDPVFIPGTNTGCSIQEFEILPDGRILVGEIFYQPTQFGNLRLLSSIGQVDSSFPNSIAGGGIFSMLDLKNGKALVGGSFSYLGNQGKNSIAKLVLYSEPFSSQRLITGRVHLSQDTNCIFNVNESPYVYRVLKAEPGPIFGFTNGDGKYQIGCDIGSYAVSQIVPNYLSQLEQQICPPNNAQILVDFNQITGDTASGVDFANLKKDCPFLTLSLSASRKRRCFKGKTRIQVCNIGSVHSSDQTEVKLKLPAYSRLVSSSSPFNYLPIDSSYSFPLGSIQPNSCQFIEILDSVACVNGITGLMQCTRAWVNPPNQCPNLDLNWDGVDIKVSSSCQNGIPKFHILNQGSDMTSTRPYRIFIDSILAYSADYQLAANGSMSVSVPALSGHLVRLETNQSPGHPSQTFASAQISCGTGSQGFQHFFSIADDNLQIGEDCKSIIDSYDPNEKEAYPKGWGSQNYILPDRNLHYTIHFQNTGTDTAFNVVLVDTLDKNLDIAWLQIGNASHPFLFKVSGKGRPVLIWTFNNILLPDSGRNQEKSNGFVSFSIRPKTGLPPGTSLENFADIFFDFNDPVRTNTTVNTLWQPTFTPGVLDTVFVTSIKNSMTSQSFKIQPNPASGSFEIRFPNTGETQKEFEITDLQGRVLKSGLVISGDFITISDFSPGLYFVKADGFPVQRLVVKP